jgi:hypothetical protein
MNTQHSRAVKGKIVGINKTSKDIEGAVRLTKDTNMAQLVTGNNIIVYTDSTMSEEMIFKAGIALNVHQAKSVVFQGEDWPFQLRLEEIS